MRKKLQLTSMILMVMTLALVFGAVQVSAAEYDKEDAGKIVSCEELLPDHDELVYDYFTETAKASLNRQKSGTASRKYSSTPARNNLSKRERIIYDSFMKEIHEIATGERETTNLIIFADEFLEKSFYSFKELGIDYDGSDLTDEQREKIYNTIGVSSEKMFNALCKDNPSEMFWSDSMYQVTYFGYGYPDFYIVDEGEPGIEIPSYVSFSMPLYVSKDYSKDGSAHGTSVDVAKIKATNTAAQNAAAIVNSASSKTDYEKLYEYSKQICELNVYNDEAASSSDPDIYGNPWQMIYVFDKDPATNVVCEGYSKAFKHLCDLSTFSSGLIQAYIVTGYGNGGAHMWNIVRMNDGRTYHTDVTFSDGYDDPKAFFLKGTSETTDDYYVIALDSWDKNYYQYDRETKELYTAEELALTTHDYIVGTPDNQTKEEEEAAIEKDKQAAEEASPVSFELNMLPSPEEVSIDDESYIKKIRDDYNALSPEAKAKISESLLQKLTDAEARIEELKKEEDKKDDSGSGSGDSGSGSGDTPSGDDSGSDSGNTPSGDDSGSGNDPSSGDDPSGHESTWDSVAAVAYLAGNYTFTYDGKVKNPRPGAFRALTYEDLTEGTDYKLIWHSDRKSIGQHCVTVEFLGKYADFNGSEDLYYTINPAKAKLSKAKAAKRKIKLTWKKQGGGVKYQIAYKYKGSWKYKTSKSAKYTLKKLKSKKKYQVKVRSFKKIDGYTYYGAWSKTKKVKVK